MDDVWDLLAAARGQRLNAVDGLVYTPAGTDASACDHISQVMLTIGIVPFRFRCASDGETIDIGVVDQLISVDMGTCGRLQCCNLSEHARFEKVVTATLTQVQVATREGRRIGIVLEFPSQCLVICNWGDDLRIWDHVPEALFVDDNVLVKPLTDWRGQ
ncbi:MAG: hypothetical protein ABFC96_01080 [Thermoguttaceae bacterium]